MAGLVLSVVAAFFYLRIIKVMWFDAPPEGTVAKEPLEAKGVAIVAGLFSMAGVWFALGFGFDTLATAAASALSLR